MAIADKAKTAAESRRAGGSGEKTIAFVTGRQAPEQPKYQANAAVIDADSAPKLTPNQASAEAFENCFEAE
jgi:hypothetical protein